MPWTRAEQTYHSQLVTALKRCSRAGDLECGKKLHKNALLAECQTSIHVASALINMYTKCGSMRLAREVFDSANTRDVVLWNCLIRGYVDNNEPSIALDLLQRIDSHPDPFTYAAGLKACASLASSNEREKARCLERGMNMHREVTNLGFGSDIVIASSLVYMYGKCGSMAQARKVFDGLKRKNVVTWTSLILGYVENGESELALELFKTMDCEPNSHTFVAALKAIASLASSAQNGLEKDMLLEAGIELHRRVKTLQCDSNVFVGNALVDMYCKSGCLHAGFDVFQRALQKNVVTWNSLTIGYVDNGENLLALELLHKMDCQPDRVTYIAAVKACAGLASLEKGILFHQRIKEAELGSDIALATTLIDMYSKCGSMRHAREVFDGIPSKNTVTWTCLILGYVDNGESSEALDIFSKMNCEPNSVTFVAVLKACGSLATERELEKQGFLEKGISIHAEVKARGLESSIVVATALVDMYCKCGSSVNARDIFDKVPQKDVVLWNCLISGYVETRESFLAMKLFTFMDCKPNCLTYLAALKACGSLSAVADGKQIHASLCKLGLEEDEQVKTALVDLYGRSGCISTATELFVTLSSPGIVSWNTLLAGYSSAGDYSKLFAAVRQIEETGIQMDHVTFIAILTACSHAGLIEECIMYFESMRERYGVEPGTEHFSIVIDMLGRVNRLDEALALVSSKRSNVDNITWMSLLGACRKWNNLEVGRAAFDELVASNIQDAAAYVLMSGLYKSMTGSEARAVEYS